MITTFPNNLVFSDITATLKSVDKRDAKNIKATYTYQDPKTYRKGLVTGELYPHSKIGSEVVYTLEILNKMVERKTVTI